MILTYKYRLKDRSARKALARHAFAVNQVWNYCNAFQHDIEDRYRAGAPKRKWPTTYEFHKLTGGTSKDLGILAGTINEVCRYFCQSRDVKRKSVRFRASKGPKRSLGWIPFREIDRQICGNSITYSGKRFRWFGDRALPEIVKGGAFVEDACGKWWVCLQVEVEALAVGNGTVGIDLGLKTLATLSDGITVPAMQNYRRWQVKLARAQRSRRKGLVRSIHARIANARRDQLHKASHHIARDNSLIAVGDVSSSKLAKTRMAKSVNDAGWHLFKQMLRYKASRHGATYVDVDEKFTTQTCSSCGSLPPERPRGIAGLGIREWDCSDCGAHHDRDVNAARNILALALSAQRPVEESRDDVPDKREGGEKGGEEG